MAYRAGACLTNRIFRIPGSSTCRNSSSDLPFFQRRSRNRQISHSLVVRAFFNDFSWSPTTVKLNVVSSTLNPLFFQSLHPSSRIVAFHATSIFLFGEFWNSRSLLNILESQGFSLERVDLIPSPLNTFLRAISSDNCPGNLKGLGNVLSVAWIKRSERSLGRLRCYYVVGDIRKDIRQWLPPFGDLSR